MKCRGIKVACACGLPDVEGEGSRFKGQELLRSAAAGVVMGEVARRSPGQNT